MSGFQRDFDALKVKKLLAESNEKCRKIQEVAYAWQKTAADLQARLDAIGAKETLDELVAFAKRNDLAIMVYYSDGVMDVNVTSVAPSEEFHMKRIPSVGFFIQSWMEHVARGR